MICRTEGIPSIALRALRYCAYSSAEILQVALARSTLFVETVTTALFFWNLTLHCSLWGQLAQWLFSITMRYVSVAWFRLCFMGLCPAGQRSTRFPSLSMSKLANTFGGFVPTRAVVTKSILLAFAKASLSAPLNAPSPIKVTLFSGLASPDSAMFLIASLQNSLSLCLFC